MFDRIPRCVSAESRQSERSKRRTSWLPGSSLAIAIGSLLACGPVLVLPGGALDGPTTEVPANWDFTQDVSTIQLETTSDVPYSVNIWAIGIADQLYVHAGTNRAKWIENMETNALVRARIEGEIYDLRATRVESQDEFLRFADLYEQKYGNRPRNENIEEIHLYRLAAR